MRFWYLSHCRADRAIVQTRQSLPCSYTQSMDGDYRLRAKFRSLAQISALRRSLRKYDQYQIVCAEIPNRHV